MNKREFENLFEIKYNDYGNMLYKIAFLYLGNASDAEDILQDVFTKYLCGKYKFKNSEHEKAWFIRVTQNKCLDYLKKSGCKNICIDDIPITSTYENSDIEQDVISKVIALPEKYKSVIILFYYNDYTVEKISTTLRISKSAVKKRLQRGRDILKLELEVYAL
ncbi:MAG: sigma-70 family RNA polymerase sigma factor [Clostridia bacterium]|nr:sigma-70 family RNA polymerase sigma factor [Clostridia bacterium]